MKHFKVPGIWDTIGAQDKVSKLFKFKNVREAVDFTVSRMGFDSMTPLKPPSVTTESKCLSTLKADQCYICEKVGVDKMKKHLEFHSLVYCDLCDKLFQDKGMHGRRCSEMVCLVCGDVASRTKLVGTTSCLACSVMINYYY